MKNFLVITNKLKDTDLEVTDRVVNYLEEKGAVCQVMADLGREYNELPDPNPETECILVIGGDGTILQVARVVVEDEIPMVGINLGNLGFLTDIETGSLEQDLDRLLEDDYEIEERMMLEGQIFHGDEKIYDSVALNDIVITRSGFSRIIECKIWVNGKKMSNYQGDGLIVSTPTGSTGYNLSAGGPVVCPRADIMLVTPICPHTIGARSSVLVSSDDIWIEIGRLRKTQEEEAIATFDGQTGIRLTSGDRIHVCPSEKKTYLIKMEDHNFYEILHNKIRVGEVE